MSDIKEVLFTEEEIKTLKGWIGNPLDNLSTAYEKFRDIERDKVIDNPKLFNLTNYLLTYLEIQKEKESILKKIQRPIQ